jgi:hypothetical protein
MGRVGGLLNASLAQHQQASSRSQAAKVEGLTEKKAVDSLPLASHNGGGGITFSTPIPGIETNFC